MHTIYVQRNERFQPSGVAVYRDTAEIRQDMDNLVERTSTGEPYAGEPGAELFGDAAIDFLVEQFMDTVETMTVPDSFAIPESGYFVSMAEFESAIGLAEGRE